MIERAERQDIEKLVATMVERAIAKALVEQPSPGESDIAALNQQKRLELLDRVIRLEERSIRLEKRTIRLEEGQKHLQEGQKAIIQEMNRRFTEMREDSDKRFTEMQKATDRRFTEMQKATDRRFTEMQEGQKVIIQEMNRRFQFVQRLIVAVGGFLGLVMTLWGFFS